MTSKLLAANDTVLFFSDAFAAKNTLTPYLKKKVNSGGGEGILKRDLLSEGNFVIF